MKDIKIFKQELYQWFESHLYSTLIEEENHDEFIKHVSENYIQHLIEQGFVALRQVEAIAEEIECEVRDMLRIKTYGYFNLNEFRSSLFDDKKRRGIC